jgi:protocatechuate 3,4-dioxygenase beta subunit
MLHVSRGEAEGWEAHMSLVSRRFRIVALSLATVAASAVATAASAAADQASITGTVVALDTGQPPSTGACLDAYGLSDSTPVTSSCMDPQTGAFTLDGLQAGLYYQIRVRVGLPYPIEMWLSGVTRSDADLVAAPATVTVNVPLAGSLTGTLSLYDGQPAAGIPVLPYSWLNDLRCCGQATTGADGRWTISGLYPGSYKVAFDYCCELAWAVVQTPWGSNDQFFVPQGGTTVVDYTLPARTSVSGTITDARTGAPVEGVCITLWSDDPNAGGGRGGCSDQSGFYWATDITPGDFRIEFTDLQGRYAPEFYDNVTDRASATVVSVPFGVQVSGIDAALTPGAVIAGRAVDANTRKPVVGVCPYAYAGRTGPQIEVQHGECSQEDGRWRVSGLPAGATTVYLRPINNDYLPIWAYSSSTQAKANVFTVQAGATTTLRDIRLTLGGTLAGVVTDAQTGAPVAGAWVTIDPFTPRDDPFYLLHVAQTDSTGHYQITGLAGDYTPLTFDQQGVYGFEWSGDAGSQATATTITIRAGRTTTYNVALDPAAILTGQVIGASGAPSGSNALVDVFTTTGDQVGWTSDVRPDGTFAVTGLPGGDVVVRLTYGSPGATGAVVWHDGVPTRDAASPVSTSSDVTTAIVTHVPWD